MIWDVTATGEIREATLDDMPTMLKWGALLFKRARWPEEMTYCPESTRVTITAMIKDATQTVLIHPHGFIGAVLCPAFFNHRITLGKKLWWYTEPGHGDLREALLLAIERWAYNAGADWFFANATEALGGPIIGQIYEDLDYRLAERSYFKRLNHGH